MFTGGDPPAPHPFTWLLGIPGAKHDAQRDLDDVTFDDDKRLPPLTTPAPDVNPDAVNTRHSSSAAVSVASAAASASIVWWWLRAKIIPSEISPSRCR